MHTGDSAGRPPGPLRILPGSVWTHPTVAAGNTVVLSPLPRPASSQDAPVSRTPRAGSPCTDQTSYAITPRALPGEPQEGNPPRSAPGNTGGLRVGERARRTLPPLHVLLSSPGNSADPAAPAPHSPGARSSLSAPRMQPREVWGRMMRGGPRRLPAHQPGAVLRSFSPRRQGPRAGWGRSKGSPSTHTPSRSLGMLGGTCCPDPTPTPGPGTDREEEGPDWTKKPWVPTQDSGVRKSETDGTGQAGPWKEVSSGPRELTPGPPWEHSHPPGSPPHVQVGGHWLFLDHRQRHTPGHSSSS